MKKIIFMVAFLLIFVSAYARRPISFNKFALDEDQTATVKIIEQQYKGKYTVDEWGGYAIAVDADKTVTVYFEGDVICYISVEQRNMKYSAYLSLVNKIISKHGEPKGSYIDEGTYLIYWWASDPEHDVRISITLKEPYTVTEMVFYGQ
jgi:hypothetical protein